jgi:iron(III) transport system permease protein
MAETVLGEYLLNTALLCVGVAALALVMGAGTAWLVTMYRFPGQRILNWALVLPLAAPAYVLAYAYTDLLQVTGPVQTALRDLTGWGVRDYWFPNVRSVGGAAFVLASALYPYVYVLARAAFLEQSVCALEVSRTLGCSAYQSFRRVGLPLARPAIAAGLAFVVMETLADFGAVAYFEVRTFTTGIYRAWYALGSPAASAQLALCLLGMVLLVLAAERLSRGRAQFSNNTTHIFKQQSVELKGAKASQRPSPARSRCCSGSFCRRWPWRSWPCAPPTRSPSPGCSGWPPTPRCWARSPASSSSRSRWPPCWAPAARLR